MVGYNLQGHVQREGHKWGTGVARDNMGAMSLHVALCVFVYSFHYWLDSSGKGIKRPRTEFFHFNFTSLTLFLPLLATERNGSFTISSSFHFTLADTIPIGGHPRRERGREFILQDLIFY